jgi:hypothetical protein
MAQVVPQTTASVVGICDRRNGKNLEGDNRALIDKWYNLGMFMQLQKKATKNLRIAGPDSKKGTSPNASPRS